MSLERNVDFRFTELLIYLGTTIFSLSFSYVDIYLVSFFFLPCMFRPLAHSHMTIIYTFLHNYSAFCYECVEANAIYTFNGARTFLSVGEIQSHILRRAGKWKSVFQFSTVSSVRNSGKVAHKLHLYSNSNSNKMNRWRSLLCLGVYPSPFRSRGSSLPINFC